jgi:hypothetical protein
VSSNAASRPHCLSLRLHQCYQVIPIQHRLQVTAGLRSTPLELPNGSGVSRVLMSQFCSPAQRTQLRTVTDLCPGQQVQLGSVPLNVAHSEQGAKESVLCGSNGYIINGQTWTEGAGCARLLKGKSIIPHQKPRLFRQRTDCRPAARTRGRCRWWRGCYGPGAAE